MSGRSGNGGQQKMRIRPFMATIDEQYVTQTWELLKRAIQEIQRKNNSGLSFEELYRNAYTMVLHKHGERLYNGLKDVIQDHMASVRIRIIESMNSGSFLETVAESWADHTVAMVMIRDILMYMDRIYVAQNNHVLPVYNLGLDAYRTEILRQNGIGDRIRDALLELIKLDRKSNQINWHGIKNACDMLISLGIDSRTVYEDEFERPLLKETSDYYRDVCKNWLSGDNDACFYLAQVEIAMHDEASRASRYLDKMTEAKILQVMDDVMVAEHIQTIVYMQNGGVKFMLEHKKIEDLTRIFRIFKRIGDSVTVPGGGLKALLKAVSEYLNETGSNIVKNEDLLKNPVNFVNELLQLKDYFSSLLTTAFADDRDFKNRFQHDFETFLNSNRQSPEFVALYMDDMLRSGLKCVSDAEMDNKLDNVMILFRYLQEKDVFEKYFKQYLAKRLLLDKSCSDDVEKALLAKLKTECGCQFTQKLENMFRDKELWLTLATSFRDWREAQPTKMSIDISLRVLTAGVWPTVQCNPVVLPQELSVAYEMFTQYYTEKHTGRKLTINTLLGNADVKATFYPPPKASMSNEENGPGPSSSGESMKERKPEHKILQVNTHQMIILLQFNHHNRISCQQLMDELKIPERELKRNLQSLALGKASQRILVRKNKGKDAIDMSDEFAVNDNFQSKLTRVKVQMVTGKVESEPEIRETRQKVEDDRKLEVEAAIVRIMKARKKLNHNNLVAEVTQQLRHRFMPSPIIIKQRIETLIEREYLARDEHDHRAYQYIA
ncbi:Cullin-3 [Caenorhabditis elegans]|uniref:Cullin-3 n=4 Tax=Caenorhabditis elegans TaxID=6239 RepID=CUL3_CAEEL|nr:Cullin-3 [Caenorhabditis elegans]Q17391.2 RecName: Full=Cullin-3; Short=CUL-3 [Caenorhabditis elegans]CCD74336.1 Cullin-3 [Caenorhabditis elegans]|eukprot:NP_503151.1 Cullin-3 [Caenorhabditis elegans]